MERTRSPPSRMESLWTQTWASWRAASEPCIKQLERVPVCRQESLEVLSHMLPAHWRHSGELCFQEQARSRCHGRKETGLETTGTKWRLQPRRWRGGLGVNPRCHRPHRMKVFPGSARGKG
uniref:Uncharacterized protein n=1 Tax=Pipistrellus kuhlii TaxID=59472 RepID=A0A7J7YX49_PIPKU|nr:hypothetical protein mPipKuh1_009924 [Pipistrellus kuhlii]